MLRALFLSSLLLSCAEVKNQARLGLGGTGSSQSPATRGEPPNAAASVGAAIGASIASRAAGGCVAACPPGTLCNTQTGLCDAQPCRGLCQADEVCENERCIPVLLPGLIIKR